MTDRSDTPTEAPPDGTLPGPAVERTNPPLPMGETVIDEAEQALIEGTAEPYPLAHPIQEPTREPGPFEQLEGPVVPPLSENASRPSRPSLGRLQKVLFGVAFAVHVLISFHGLNEAFIEGHHGWAASMRGAIARNYDRFGLFETGLKPYKNFGPMAMDKAPVHWHHPPTVNLMAWLSTSIFGESEAAIRLPTVLCSILAFLLLWILVRRRYGPWAGLIAVGVFALLPMQVEYGKLVNYEVPIVMLVLGALVCLQRLRELDSEQRGGRRRWMACLVIALLIAGWIDWPAFIFAFFIGLDAVIRKPRQFRVFVFVGVSTTLLLAFLMWWLGQEGGAEGWSGLSDFRSGNTTVGALFDRVIHRSWDYFGPVPLACLVIFAIFSDIKRTLDPTVFVFGGGSVVYFLAFKQAAWIHNFYMYLLVPAVAVWTALAVVWTVGKARELPHGKSIATVTALMFGVSFLVTDVAALPGTHARSYGVLPPKRPARGFPADGHLQRVIISKLVRKMTKPEQTVVVHSGLPLPPQMKYYMARNTRQMRSTSPPSTAGLFLIAERALPRSTQRKLTRKYPVVRVLGYLAYDLDAKGPHVRSLVVQPQPNNAWHWYFTSSFYPPHELVFDRDESEAYARKMGLKPGTWAPKPDAWNALP